jgi:transposase
MTDQEKILDLETRLAFALTRIEELESLLSISKIVKTSKNSHLSPSADLGRKNKSLREKSDKPVGGQKGHEGHTLEMSATPDIVVPLQPSFCSCCGKSLLDSSFHFDTDIVNL